MRASGGIVRYEAQIAFGITVSRHLITSDELATADPAHVIELLRPCMLSLTARPDRSGPRKR